MRDDNEAGFVLLEIVAAMAIAGMLFALVMPWIVQRTSTLPLEALLARTEATLRDTRSAALLANRPAAVRFEPQVRRLSGRSDSVIFPADLAVTMTTGGGCDQSGRNVTLIFQPDGSNCGAIIKFQHGRRVVRLRVNGLTGAVDIRNGEVAASR